MSRRPGDVLLAVAFLGGCVAWAFIIENPNPPQWWNVLLACIAVTVPIVTWATRA